MFSDELPYMPKAANRPHCCLCLNVEGRQVEATTQLAGYAVCARHGVIEKWVFTTDNQPNLLATVAALRNARRAGLGSV